MTDPLRNLAPGATFKLPSVEQMRREVESGEFSPESVEIAKRIQMEAENAEQSRLYQEKLDMGLLVGSGVKPNLKELSKHFVKHVEKTTVAMVEVTKAAKKATRTFREMGKKLAQIDKPTPGAKLQHRPFHTPELQLLRDQLASKG